MPAGAPRPAGRRSRLREVGRDVAFHLHLAKALARDPRVPAPARWLVAAAAGYFLLPFDLIPDFIPVLGHADDAVIVPALLLCALALMPREVAREYWARARRGRRG